MEGPVIEGRPLSPKVPRCPRRSTEEILFIPDLTEVNVGYGPDSRHKTTEGTSLFRFTSNSYLIVFECCLGRKSKVHSKLR